MNRKKTKAPTDSGPGDSNRNNQHNNINMTNIAKDPNFKKQPSPLPSNTIPKSNDISSGQQPYIEGGYPLASYNDMQSNINQYNNSGFVPDGYASPVGGSLNRDGSYGASPSHNHPHNHNIPTVYMAQPDILPYPLDNGPDPYLPPLQDAPDPYFPPVNQSLESHYTPPQTHTQPSDIKRLAPPPPTTTQYLDNYAIYAVVDKSKKAKNVDNLHSEATINYDISESQFSNNHGNSDKYPADGAYGGQDENKIASDTDNVNMEMEENEKSVVQPKSILKNKGTGKVTFDLPPDSGENA